jgi:hypothetical protein
VDGLAIPQYFCSCPQARRVTAVTYFSKLDANPT